MSFILLKMCVISINKYHYSRAAELKTRENKSKKEILKPIYTGLWMLKLLNELKNVNVQNDYKK